MSDTQNSVSTRRDQIFCFYDLVLESPETFYAKLGDADIVSDVAK